MSDILKAASLTLRILEARNTMRALYRDNYAKETADWRVIIGLAMKKFSCGTLEAIPHIVRTCEEKGSKMAGISIALLFSAAADMLDEERKAA